MSELGWWPVVDVGELVDELVDELAATGVEVEDEDGWNDGRLDAPGDGRL